MSVALTPGLIFYVRKKMIFKSFHSSCVSTVIISPNDQMCNGNMTNLSVTFCFDCLLFFLFCFFTLHTSHTHTHTDTDTDTDRGRTQQHTTHNTSHLSCALTSSSFLWSREHKFIFSPVTTINIITALPQYYLKNTEECIVDYLFYGYSNWVHLHSRTASLTSVPYLRSHSTTSLDGRKEVLTWRWKRDINPNMISNCHFLSGYVRWC